MKYFGIITLLIIFGTVALTACGSRSGNLEDHLWQMTSYRNADGEMIETLPDVKSTAEFKDGNLSGKAACNTYNGSYLVDGDRISFGPLMSTMMACEPATMDQETGYLAAIDLADTFVVKGESLEIFDQNGEIVLAFVATESPSLVGTSWLLTFYNNGKGGMQSVIIDTEITADFSEDGTMSGSAGCNRYNTSFEAADDTISIGVAASTEMACMDPEGIMEQEIQYLAALQNAATYTIQGDRLEIRDENGSGVAYYIVAP